MEVNAQAIDDAPLNFKPHFKPQVVESCSHVTLTSVQYRRFCYLYYNRQHVRPTTNLILGINQLMRNKIGKGHTHARAHSYIHTRTRSRKRSHAHSVTLQALQRRACDKKLCDASSHITEAALQDRVSSSQRNSDTAQLPTRVEWPVTPTPVHSRHTGSGDGGTTKLPLVKNQPPPGHCQSI